MKSASALLGAASAPAPAGKTGASDAGNTSGKPEFGELLRKHDRTQADAGAQSARADIAAAKKPAEAPAASADETSSRPRKATPAEDWMNPAAGAWGMAATLEPAGISPTTIGSDAAEMTPPLASAQASVNAATAAAASPANPSNPSSQPSLLPAGAAATSAIAGDPVAATALLAANGENAATAQSATTADAGAPAQAAAAAKPVQQNPQPSVQHLVASVGAAAVAVPEALGLVKDAVDALRRDIDTESAAPTVNALASASPVSSNGLARTATVNPLQVPSPDLHSEHFDEAIGTRLSWMADQKIGHAHIKVSPGEMGMIEVRLRMDGDRIHADFSSAQPEVRQALEASLPRLREMLDQQGFQLTQADVGHHQDPQAPAQSGGRAAGSEDGTGGAGDESQSPRPVITHTRGLLDAYA